MTLQASIDATGSALTDVILGAIGGPVRHGHSKY
jgi:hypothetical protein